jgi:hypothetical protein
VPAAALFPEAAAANRGVFFRNGQALSAAEVYANLTRTGGADYAALDAKAGADPGQAAFAHYADARRSERQIEQNLLIEMILGGTGGLSGLGFGGGASGRSGGGGSGGPVASMFSAEMLKILAEAKLQTP